MSTPMTPEELVVRELRESQAEGRFLQGAVLGGVLCALYETRLPHGDLGVMVTHRIAVLGGKADTGCIVGTKWEPHATDAAASSTHGDQA
jgi:hypothetical protein